MNEIEAYIRQVAPRYGIDPDVAVAVARSEGGLHDPFRQGEAMLKYGREESYGPFQLHMRWGGLGTRALAAGIDPRKDWQGGVNYALEEAGKRGWGQWFGAARTGIGNYQGIGGKRQPVDTQAVASTTAGPTTVRHPPNPTVGTGGYTAPTVNTTPVPPAAAAKGSQPWAKSLSGLASSIGDAMQAPVVGRGGAIPQLPTQAPMPQGAMPMIAESMADENRRNQLAALMQQYWI